MSPSQVIFFGTPDFACPSLRAIAEDPSFEITSVITQPDRPAGRGGKLRASPVKGLAEKLKIPVLQPEDVNLDLETCLAMHFGDKHVIPSSPELVEGRIEGRLPPRATRHDIDFLVVVAYGQILGEKLLAWPKIAPVNLHASLLPRFRGASPIEHAILAGDMETGVTVQRMVKELDAGPILGKERISLEPRETAGELREKLAEIGAELLLQTLKKPLQEIPQDPSKAKVCHKLTRTMGEVDPGTMTAEEIDRRVRALVPWPGVRMKLGKEEVKILETSLEPHKDTLTIPCAKSTMLYVLRLQRSGKAPVTAQAWLAGQRMKT